MTLFNWALLWLLAAQVALLYTIASYLWRSLLTLQRIERAVALTAGLPYGGRGETH